MKLFSKNIAYALLIFLFIAVSYSIFTESFKEHQELSLSELVQKINAEEISKILVTGDQLQVTLKNGSLFDAKKEEGTSLTQTLSNYGVAKEKLLGFTQVEKNPSGVLFWLGAILPTLITIIFFVGFFWYMGRQVNRANIQAFGFGQSRARLISPDNYKERIMFKDVAGVDEAKEELREIVEFLKHPKKFFEVGARIPRGVLLMGAPGTGKTLLARAVAGEAGVPFFQISASEFVEMFVGVGASRVRDLFRAAKKAAPSIVFIDEIDAIGRHRGAGLGGGHDEREQTLNQILVEMDGFETRDQVIIMAATNRPDVLDPALLRPGRFDRRVVLDLPDIKQREAILAVHSMRKPLAKGVRLKHVAERTPGFSGADLENLVNEGAILAARTGRKEITESDLLQSIDKVMLGPERKSFVLTEEEKKISAYHEAGHALVAASLPHTDPVHKVSIISRGRALGYTMKLPTFDRHLYSRSHFMDELAVSLGGYAAEEVVFGELTTGASDDLRKATAIARDLVQRYGMSKKLGPMTFGEHSDLVFLGKELSVERNYSEETAYVIDKEVSSFIKKAFKRAHAILVKRRQKLEELARHLIEHETIERDEFARMVAAA
ncbi:MAG: ATP-dependent metallopeptidase FtsH/Yme1/Tma family protein [Candidatus Ryanbacteria bacterium]|nr:ATP-dependent metallopeptidase FtsH/Yme1/Tma family protein [Candidatus Ryanbacteria bacterium]